MIKPFTGPSGRAERRDALGSLRSCTALAASRLRSPPLLEDGERVGAAANVVASLLTN
jgi:hypothetical protein